MKSRLMHQMVGSVSLLALGVGSTAAQEISWVPVDADGPFALAGSNGVGDPTIIVLVPGRGYRVEFELRVSGWADAPGSPTLGTAQATLDLDGLLGVNANPPNPGVDLLTLNEPPYGPYTGAYMQLKSCITFSGVNTGQRCDTLVPPLPSCPSGTYCGDNPEFMFPGCLFFTTVELDPFAWAAISCAGVCKTDTGDRSWYLGTFIFDVPASATGRYSFGFDPAPAASFLNNCGGSKIPGRILTPGVVTIAPSDCNNNGVHDVEDIASGTSPDSNRDGFPDECVAFPPRPAPYPHDRLKNRYMSFDPDKAENDGSNVAFQVTLRSLTLGSCSSTGAPCRLKSDENLPNEPGDADCGMCSWFGSPCITAYIDCEPSTQSCIPSGQVCVNDQAGSVGRSWWVGPASPRDPAIHLLVSEPFRKVSPNWGDVVHVGDCEIVPIATYGVRAVNVDTGFVSAELAVHTARRPANGIFAWWADVVGPLRSYCDGDLRNARCEPGDPPCPAGQACRPAWELPDGFTNFDDYLAVDWLFMRLPGTTLPEPTWVDLHGNDSGQSGSQAFDPPNGVANHADMQQVVLAFMGRPYPFFDPADCPDVGTWP